MMTTPLPPQLRSSIRSNSPSNVRGGWLTCFCILALALLGAAPCDASGLTRVFYPSDEAPQFTVLIPSSWKMIPQGKPGAQEGYFEVEGPNLYLSFRLVPGGNMEKAIAEHIAYLKSHYTDLEFAKEPEVHEFNGMKGYFMPATGKDENGDLRELGSGWFVLNKQEELIGELWFDVKARDENAIRAAERVLNSVRVAHR